MKRTNNSLVAVVLGCFGLAVSCSDDDSVTDAPTLYGFTAGDSCFVVTAVGSVDDGCEKGSILNAASATDPLTIPFNYDATTRLVQVGTEGSLGRGPVSNNEGTLIRDNITKEEGNLTCMWRQQDTSEIKVIANNTFTISVTEVQSEFTAACTPVPAGGMCTSKWTWTMTKSTTKVFPNCD